MYKVLENVTVAAYHAYRGLNISPDVFNYTRMLSR